MRLINIYKHYLYLLNIYDSKKKKNQFIFIYIKMY